MKAQDIMSRYLFSLGTLSIFICAFMLGGCAMTGDQAPYSVNNDVVLLSTQEFPDFAAHDVAKLLAKDTGLTVRAITQLGTKDWQPYDAGGIQYNPFKLMDLAAPAIEQLKRTHGGKVYILLTTRDLNNPEFNVRFLFSGAYPTRKVAVVSSARMGDTRPGSAPFNSMVIERLRKMALRAVAEHYYGLQRSADPKDLMFAPIMSLDALDIIQPVLRR